MNNMNKKTYMLPGDERIVAGNAEEFVHELRVGSWMDSDCTAFADHRDRQADRRRLLRRAHPEAV